MIGVGGVYLFVAAVWYDVDSFSVALVATALVFALIAWFAWRRSSRWRRDASRWQFFFDTISNPVLVTDSEGRIIEGNASARSRLGVVRAARRSQHLLTLIEPEEELTYDDLAARACTDSEESVAVRRVEEEDGPYWHARAIRQKGPTGDRIIWSLHDVTATRREIDQYELFLDHLIRQLPVEVAILAPDGRYQYLSSSFIAEERRRKWLIGRTDFDYCKEFGLHLELALRRRAHRMEAIDRRETIHFEENLPVGNEERRLAWRYSPFVDHNGEVSMVLGFGVDLTELVRCRAELQEAREEAQKAARLKDALMQNVSHEIRTPLAGIIGTAQMLQPDVPDNVREFLTNIEESGLRLAETLNEMLDLAGLQAESIENRPEIVNLAEEVQEVLRSLQSVVDRRGLFLRVNVAQPEILVHADRSALYRSLRNLVDNAIKFTTDGGILLDVSASYEYAYLRVMDTGVGIDDDAKDDVFEAFSQEESGHDRSFEGVGLGLAVTKRLLAMMDGEIRVHSQKGSGSSFVVRLPLIEPDLRRRGSWRSKILVADGQRETHRMIGHMLQDYFSFESVHTLEELAERASNGVYDLVMVDSRIEPELEPQHLLAAVHGIAGLESMPCILIDHQRLPGRKVTFIRQGWDDCVAKPLRKLDLLNVLYTHTGEAREAVAQ